MTVEDKDEDEDEDEDNDKELLTQGSESEIVK